MRRFGTPPRPGVRYTGRPGVYAVIARGDRLLVTEQADPGPEIQLPGGGIDRGETPVRALHREVLEETGWTVEIVTKIAVYQRFTWMPEYRLQARKLCHIYLCRPGLRRGAPLEPGHRALWLPARKAIPLLGSPGDGHYAARALGL